MSKDDAITVSDVGEFGLIARVTAELTPADTTLLGPGDDAAVVRAADGRVVATTDMLSSAWNFLTGTILPEAAGLAVVGAIFNYAQLMSFRD